MGDIYLLPLAASEHSVMAIDAAPAYPTQPRLPELFDPDNSPEEVADNGSREGARR